MNAAAMDSSVSSFRVPAGHRPVREGEDSLYVLLTSPVIPLRWVDRHGWRKPTDTEIEAALSIYAELGKRMGLDPVPKTYAEACRLLDDYEDRNVAASPEGEALLAAAAEALAVRLPKRLKSRTPLASALMTD